MCQNWEKGRYDSWTSDAIPNPIDQVFTPISIKENTEQANNKFANLYFIGRKDMHF